MDSASWSSTHSLAVLKRDGLADEVPAAARKVRASLAPADHNRLVDRLTALGMMMAPNRPPAEAAIWLRETARLLSDLPEDILGDAIDTALKTSKFLPTVAEIRERADSVLAQRRRVVQRLDAMERLIASGANVPPAPPYMPGPSQEEVIPCTPEQAAVIMEEMGLHSETRATLQRHLGPPRNPTRADYIAMGVEPEVLDRQRA